MNVHANWVTQPRAAKFYHLKTVHGMNLTEGSDAITDPFGTEVSTGFLDDVHKQDHRAPATFLVNREHKHNGGF